MSQAVDRRTSNLVILMIRGGVLENQEGVVTWLGEDLRDGLELLIVAAWPCPPQYC